MCLIIRENVSSFNKFRIGFQWHLTFVNVNIHWSHGVSGIKHVKSMLCLPQSITITPGLQTYHLNPLNKIHSPVVKYYAAKIIFMKDESLF